MEYDFDYSLFQLKKDYFDHDSSLHGINHTYRVMCLILSIGEAAGLNREVELAFCAAYIHDLARKHDGYCDQHGLWATQYKLPEFKSFFKKMGIKESEITLIGTAVKNHSEQNELQTENNAYKITALLKDADALDRVRLGDENLNTDYLRFPESVKLIHFAKKLYFKTRNLKISSFTEILEIVELINQ
ncbi:MAG: HD domain-containing protein [Bacteroidales bacterium]|nr:HD domain-containing protein [Bacteroidales bacterium]